MIQKLARLLLFFLITISLFLVSKSSIYALDTPLTLSGLTPIWQENFANGSIDRMQFSWAKGDNAALRSFVAPGFVYLGKDGTSTQVEQQINNFKYTTDTLLPQTLEFDVFSPFTGSGRVSIRPRRRGDMVSMNLALSKDTTKINFRYGNTPSITYTEKTGPTRGWAHITTSYRQFVSGGTTYTHYVIAVNNEIHEYTGNSTLTNPDFATYWNSNTNADSWSFEHNSTVPLYGKYIANIRGYAGFLTLDEMQSRLSGLVEPYRNSLPDPKLYQGETKLFQPDTFLEQQGPNAIIYYKVTNPRQVQFDGSLSSGWGKITSYSWDFGDGEVGSDRLITHQYASAGDYNVSLTITNKSGTKSRTIPLTLQ